MLPITSLRGSELHLIESAGADESLCYCGLAEFLTECIEIYHSSLDSQHEILPRRGRWFKNLEFTIGELVVDGGDGATPGIRTLRFAVFGGEGKPLIEAKNPHQLSRSSACFLLGAFVNILWYLHRTDLPISQDGCRHTYPAACTVTLALQWDCPRCGRTCGEGGVRDTQGVP